MSVAQDREALFHEKYAVSAFACWVWQGGTTDGGYGTFFNGRQTERAHRWAYRRFVGPIPEGMELDHVCRNKLCVNPAHLEPVTRLENIARRDGRDLNGRTEAWESLRPTRSRAEVARERAFTPEGRAHLRRIARLGGLRRWQGRDAKT